MPYDGANALRLFLPLFPPTGPSPNARGVGSWRLQGDGTPWPGLPVAIATAQRANADRPDLQALAWRVLPRVPGMPLASDTLKAANPFSAKRPLEDVVASHAWVAFNTAEATNIVWIDVDHRRWPELLKRAVAAGLPEPAWIAASKRGAHLVWILRTPVVIRLENMAREARIARLLSVTYSYLKRALDADPAASLRGMTKNPFARATDGSLRWDVTVGPIQAVSLHDLLRPLEALAAAEEWQPPTRQRRARQVDPDDLPKGSRLWEVARQRVYPLGTADFDTILEIVEAAAVELRCPAPPNQRKAVAASISRFMATRWTGQLRSPLSAEQVRAAQSAAGQATSAARAAARDGRVAKAIQELRAAGAPVTRAAVAAIAELSESTVQRAAAWRQRDGRPEVTAGGVSIAPPLSERSSPLSVSPCPSLFPGPRSPLPTVPVGAVFHRPSAASATASRASAASAVVIPFPRSRAPALTPRQASLKRTAERRAWHTTAALGGPSYYEAALAERLADLAAQRAEDFRRIPWDIDTAWVARFSEDTDADIARVFRAAERRRLVALGWSARLRAEHRLAEATRAGFPRDEVTPLPAPDPLPDEDAWLAEVPW